MVKIESFKHIQYPIVEFQFNDGLKKMIDFTSFIKDDFLTKPLSDSVYFKQMKIYENGRGIYWPNEFDFCPDFLRFHVKGLTKIPSAQIE